MKIKLLSLSLAITFLGSGLYAKNNTWNKTSKSAVSFSEKVQGINAPKSALLYQVNVQQLTNTVAQAPLRGSLTGKSSVIVSFPNTQGELEQFQVKEAPVMHPDLAAKYPDIKSYVGYGINNGKVVRFSLSPQKGLSAMIRGNGNTVFIDPYTADLTTYAVFSRENDDRTKTFNCLTNDIPQKLNTKTPNNKDADDQTLRTFELAMSATGEYTAFHGGTKASALAAINTTMTRVNGVYETDFAITMILIANTDDVIYTNANSDPYTGNLNNQLQSTLSSVIGEANYDIGHLVHRDNNNGNAGCIGCVCVNNQKGSAYTSHTSPQGDFFDIDYVVHEMGHQFGANHTHTHTGFSEGTGVQMEPGSGSTIMGYAGITGANSDVQPHSDDYFHYANIEQVTTYVKSTGCQSSAPMINTTPTANAGADFTIPHTTAFILEGAGSDPNSGDVLTYCWEQGDEGFESSNGVTSNPTSGNSPSFRSMPPTTSPNRYMPALVNVISGNLTTKWETVRTAGGTMNFSLTVRDNVSGGGQNHIDKMVVTVDGNSGPFEVTSQASNVTWTVNGTETITWNVANTTAAPVSTPNVNIYLSLDGGYTYPYTLATNVPNNGSANVTVPWSTATTQARVMVRGAGNIFYALNGSNFTISSPTGISEVNADNIKVYPNPTNNIINLSLDGTTQIEQVTLTDVQGKLVYQAGNVNATQTQIDMSNFSNGLYIIKVESSNGISLHKVTKQ